MARPIIRPLDETQPGGVAARLCAVASAGMRCPAPGREAVGLTSEGPLAGLGFGPRLRGRVRREAGCHHLTFGSPSRPVGSAVGRQAAMVTRVTAAHCWGAGSSQPLPEVGRGHSRRAGNAPAPRSADRIRFANRLQGLLALHGLNIGRDRQDEGSRAHPTRSGSLRHPGCERCARSNGAMHGQGAIHPITKGGGPSARTPGGSSAVS